jgi:predicted GIY-YIG superfamily endonuclease
MPRLPTDYSRTVIYKIIKNDDFENENVYIGSTTDFTRRKCQHKSICNNEKNKSHNSKVYKTIRENGGFSEWTMIEIEKYPCNDKREALSRERYWYEFYKAQLNSVMMIITPEEKKEYQKQYNTDNADKMKQYQIDNKEKIAEYYKQYNTDNADKLAEQAKKYRTENADKIKEYQNQKITCECGAIIMKKSNKIRHKQTQKHIKNMNSS